MIGDALQVDGVDKATAYLKGLPADADRAVEKALTDHGKKVVNAALKIVPKGKTGALGKAITTEVKADGLTVSAHSEKVPYAWTFHATALGGSNGYMVFRVNQHSRGGYPVGGYNSLRRVIDNAYLLKAWEDNAKAARAALVDAIEGVLT